MYKRQASYISLLAIYLGALIFGTAAVAPIAVGTLEENSAGVFLRRYWVVYHRFAVFGGLFFAVIAAIGSTVSAVPSRYALLLVSLAGLMTVLFYSAMRLIPSINHARDAADDDTFDRLHRLNEFSEPRHAHGDSASGSVNLRAARSVYVLAYSAVTDKPFSV